MGTTLEDFFKEQTKEITFLKVDLKELTEEVKGDEILELPFLLEDFKEGLKEEEQEIRLSTQGLIKGIGFLLGADPEFHYKDRFKVLVEETGVPVAHLLLRMSNHYEDKGERAKALVLLRGILQLEPDNLKGLFNYALLLLKHRQESEDFAPESKDEAKKALEKITVLQPEFSLPYYHLGFLYKEEMQFIKAKKTWEKAKSLGVEEHIEEHIDTLLREIQDLSLYEQGYHHILNGRTKEGLQTLIKLEDHYKDWWNLLFFIGLGYRQEENFQKALTYFQRVLKLEENLPDLHVEMGLSFAGLGKYDPAIEHLEKAMKMDPSSPEIPANLSMIYMEKGNLKKAEKLIEASLILDPRDEITLACKRQLELLKSKS